MRRAAAGTGAVLFPHGFQVLETSQWLHLSQYVTKTLSLVVKLVLPHAKELWYQNCLPCQIPKSQRVKYVQVSSFQILNRHAPNMSKELISFGETESRYQCHTSKVEYQHVPIFIGQSQFIRPLFCVSWLDHVLFNHVIWARKKLKEKKMKKKIKNSGTTLCWFGTVLVRSGDP